MPCCACEQAIRTLLASLRNEATEAHRRSVRPVGRAPPAAPLVANARRGAALVVAAASRPAFVGASAAAFFTALLSLREHLSDNMFAKPRRLGAPAAPSAVRVAPSPLLLVFGCMIALILPLRSPSSMARGLRVREAGEAQLSYAEVPEAYSS